MASPALVTAAASEAAQRRAAAGLRRAGLGPGDRVAIVADGSPAYLAVAVGALRVGIVPVLVNVSLTAPEVAALLDDAEPALVLHDDDLVRVAANDGDAELAPWPLARPMFFTSGTTGRPKGVWSGVLADHEAAALLAEERDLWGFAAGDVHLVVSPLHHSAPLRFAAGTLLAGGAVVLSGGVAHLAEAITEHRPTSAFVVPAHLQRLFAAGPGAVPPLGSFRLLAHAGAPCPEALKRRTLAAFPDGVVWEFYGSTEGQFTACSASEWLERPGTVGRARPGRRLEIGADRVIWCHAPSHARFEYWRDPEKTARAWRRCRDPGCAGAFTVGDLGRLDDDGYCYLDGRRDDLIITGGVNVYPLEVEQALLRHPGVQEAAVFPVPDERWGQMVCAAVVAPAGTTGLADFLVGCLAPYKRPKRIVEVDEIPRSSMGKVRRSELAGVLGLAPPAPPRP
ncbi:MAG: acyl--CoA ligase [Acidimicrobiales bacterium]|nr:acyl--CoA ligase [Acidimicrobiales bacterium]